MGTPANDLSSAEAQARNDEWLGELPDPDGLSNVANDASGPANPDGPINPSGPILDEDLDGKSADEIRASIEHTRSEMTHTIDALQEKLSPDAIKAQAASKLHDATLGSASRAAQAVVNKVAQMTPQPRHEQTEYPYGQSKPAWQESMSRTQLWLKQNPKIIGYLAAGGLLFLGVLAKRRANANTYHGIYFRPEFKD